MDAPSAAEILILADDQATARRWAAMLENLKGRVWLAPDDVPDPTGLDLILTNLDPANRPWSQADGSVWPADAEASSERPGVIGIGVDGPADVHLPADVAGRELLLACRLLADLVRLRRRLLAQTQLRKRFAHEALTDPVTGLPNRRAWEQALGQRLTGACDAPGSLCLAILDLDHFKRINDAHGHPAGDEVLRTAGQVISGGLRQNDFVARLGGDEFGLLLSVPDEAAARAVVERVRGGIPSGLARAGIPTAAASAGFHVAPAGRAGAPLPCPDDLFVAADAALRQAKRQGRDRTVGPGTREGCDSQKDSG